MRLVGLKVLLALSFGRIDVCAFWGGKRPPVPEGGMSCDDGYTAIEGTRVNDDYCDCTDGSDEPGTAACSRTGSLRQPSFRCENKGFESKMIWASRVNDGACGDCCDGSDEREGVCANVCDAEAAAERAEKERLALIREAGLAKRREMIDRGREEMAADKVARESAEATLAELEPRRTELQAEIDKYEALERELKSAAEETAKTNSEASLNHLMNTTTEPMQAAIAAVRLAVAASQIEALMDATTRLGGLTESVTDKFDDVDILSTGVDGSQAWNDENLDDFHAKCQHLVTLLHMHEIEIDNAKSIALDLVPSVTALNHIESLRTIDPLAAALTSISSYTPDTTSLLSPEQVEALASAKAAIIDLDTKKRQADDTLRRLRENDKFDFGPDQAFKTLKGQCFSKRIAKYNYEVCPFGAAKQDHTSIGRFGTWGNNYKAWNYEHGQNCNGIGARTLLVNLRCGDDNNLIDLSETEICKYTAIFDTPAACAEEPAVVVQ